MKNLWVFLLFLVCLTPAFADQAAYVSKAKALEAAQVVNKTRTIKTFCAPCDDVAAIEVAVRKADAVDANYKNFWEVKVNGRGIDLAYVYVKENVDENQRWRNLAMILNLPVVGVPEFIP